MSFEKIKQPENIKNNFLLTGPETISPDEIKRKDRRWSPYFFGGTHGYQLFFHNDRVGFRIEYVSQLPDELTEEEKLKFSETVDVKKRRRGKKFVYEYGEVKQAEKKQSAIGFESGYHISRPRKFKTELIKPQAIQPAECAELIKKNRVVFYTGAGISAAVGLSLSDFRENADSDLSKPADGLIRSVLSNPEKIEELLKGYTAKAFEAPATPAHKALAAIAKYKNSQIMTENFDFLQEQAGVKPYRVSGPGLKSEINPEWLKDIDLVICLGLSCDDRGFLQWYKENNQKGKIISLDIRQPNYLGDEDMFVQGSVQEILPIIKKQLKI